MIKIYVDGASKGNPGPGGSSVIAYDSKNNVILKSHTQYYENTTNNQAELKALIHAIKMAKET
jgi:ribonuclease HI